MALKPRASLIVLHPVKHSIEEPEAVVETYLGPCRAIKQGQLINLRPLCRQNTGQLFSQLECQQKLAAHQRGKGDAALMNQVADHGT
jgi:hypothetical protein